MAWKIDRDYLFEPVTGLSTSTIPSRVGTSQRTLDGVTFRFRLLDDDGEIYYGGEADTDAAVNDECEGGLYQALQWAANDSGCTDLQVHVEDGLKYGLTTQDFADRHNLKPTDWVSIYG